MEKSEIEHALMVAFKNVERTLHRSLFRTLGPQFSPSQVFVLIRLMRPSGKNTPNGTCDAGMGQSSLRVTDLASIIGISVPGMTQIITGLEKDGFIRREMDPDDRRAVRVFLTEEGRQVILPAFKYLHDLMGGLAEHLGEEDTMKIIDLLERSNNYLTEAGL